MNRPAAVGFSLVVFCVSVFSARVTPAAQEGQQPLQATARRYEVVTPGTHPGLLFSAKELPRLRRRAKGEGLAAECYRKVVELARGDAQRYSRSRKLNAMALVYQIEGDAKLGRQAVEMFKEIIAEIEPFQHYKKIDSDFFATEQWPKAFAYAWDWLYELMDEKERAEVLKGLELWCKALYEHTEAWWWRDSTINCGAIPVGALACFAPPFRGNEACRVRAMVCQRYPAHPAQLLPNILERERYLYRGSLLRAIHENPTRFGEALRRTGGPDIISTSNITKAGNYQMFQWDAPGRVRTHW